MENIKEKIEDKIIDLIALGAPGRLVAFKPEKFFVDLVVEKKGDYKKMPIFLNVYSKEQDFEAEVKQAKNINPAENFYVVFADFDFIKQNIGDNIFVVPSVSVSELSGKADFSKFSMNKKEFVSFLIDSLNKK